MAVTFVALLLIPVDFNYWVFAVLVFLNGLGGGIFAAPNTAAIMSSVPAAQRGAASGMRATFFNAGSSLSIGIFFSLMIVGPGQHAAGRAEQRPAGAGRPGIGRARGGQPAAGGQPVRGVPRLQPDRRAARARRARCSSRASTPTC